MKIKQLFEAIENKLELAKLPYKTGDLAPVLSKDNVEYHYNVLSKGYVNRYNNQEGDLNSIMVEQCYIIYFGHNLKNHPDQILQQEQSKT